MQHSSEEDSICLVNEAQKNLSLIFYVKIFNKIITPGCYRGICYYGVRSLFPLG